MRKLKFLFWTYRVLYLLLLSEFAALAITRSELSFSTEMAATGLFVLSAVLLFGAVLISGFTRRCSMKFVWGTTIAWYVLFFWWAWIDIDASPFILHELHSLDAAQAEIEARQSHRDAIALFVLLRLWFLSFPLVQRCASKAGIATGESQRATARH